MEYSMTLKELMDLQHHINTGVVKVGTDFGDSAEDKEETK